MKYILTAVYYGEACCGNYVMIDFRHIGIFNSEEEAENSKIRFDKDEESAKALQYTVDFFENFKRDNGNNHKFVKFVKEEAKYVKEDVYLTLDNLLRFTNSLGAIFDYPEMIDKYKNPYFIINDYKRVELEIRPIEVSE